jgi:pimeloyl-ACP methyl ester carboxylesterase
MSATLEIAQRMVLRGMELEVVRSGRGRPLVLLHGPQTFDPRTPFLARLAAQTEIIAPSHPGFGRSPRPDGFETIYDLTRLYLDLLEALPHDQVTLIGFSFGGWLAAEIAATCCHRIDRLVLVDPLGIKLGGRETADILDLFNTSPAEVQRRSWHDPARWAPDYDALTDAELVERARNWESLSLYGWHPYMHNPRLAHWHRLAGVWPRLCEPDPGRALHAHRAGGAPPGNRAAGGVRQPCARLPERLRRRTRWTPGGSARSPTLSCRSRCWTRRSRCAAACRTAGATHASPRTCSMR